VVYLQLNAAHHSRLIPFTEDDRRYAADWQMADQMLYAHFADKFDKQVKYVPHYLLFMMVYLRG
jgi:hypothetical protein